MRSLLRISALIILVFLSITIARSDKVMFVVDTDTGDIYEVPEVKLTNDRDILLTCNLLFSADWLYKFGKATLLYTNELEDQYGNNVKVAELKGGNFFFTSLTTTGIDKYDVTYFSANSVCSKADADIIKAASGIYLGTEGRVCAMGVFTNTNWNTTTKPTWNANDPLFLSRTAGEITDTPPSDPDTICQKLGRILYINETEAQVHFAPKPFVINRE